MYTEEMIGWCMHNQMQITEKWMKRPERQLVKQSKDFLTGQNPKSRILTKLRNPYSFTTKSDARKHTVVSHTLPA